MEKRLLYFSDKPFVGLNFFQVGLELEIRYLSAVKRHEVK